MTGRPPPEHDVAAVEASLLELVAELHPQHLDAATLVDRMVSDDAGRLKVETAERAIANLAEFGLIRWREGGIAGPTPSALRAVALLA